MTKLSQTNTSPRPAHHAKSLLDKFNIGYEYDKTWVEAKRTTQQLNNRSKKK